MSEAIRSTGAAVSGAISDRGQRGAEAEAIRSRQEENRVLNQGTGRAQRQLQEGFHDASALNRPYIRAGRQGLMDAQAHSDDFHFDESSLENSDAYKFRRDQGIEALNRSFAARGGLGSGSRMTGIMDYAQGLASTEYDNEYKRQYGLYEGNFNRNMGIAGMGMAANDAQSQNIQNYRGGRAGLIMQNTNARAGIRGEVGDIQAATTLGRAQNWASTNMYMADQAGQGFDHYVPGAGGGGGGGSKKSGGGG